MADTSQAAGRQIDVLLAPTMPDARGDAFQGLSPYSGKSRPFSSMIFLRYPSLMPRRPATKWRLKPLPLLARTRATIRAFSAALAWRAISRCWRSLLFDLNRKPWNLSLGEILQQHAQKRQCQRTALQPGRSCQSQRPRALCVAAPRTGTPTAGVIN